MDRMCGTGTADDGSALRYRPTPFKITFGYMQPLSGGDAEWETTSHMGMLCALEQIKNESKILTGIELSPLYINSPGTQSGRVTGALCLKQAEVPLILGPAYSGAAFGASTVGKVFGIPIVGTTTSHRLEQCRS